VGKHESPSGTIPDARWVNRYIDVREVARLLEIRATGRKYHCWNPANHRNGDRDESVGFWQSGNRLKCFVCDFPASGPIDLVIRVLGGDIRSALAWLTERFPGIPCIPARRAAEKPQPRYLNGSMDPLRYLAATMIQPRLAACTILVANALLLLCEPGATVESPRTGSISYKALARYSGVSSNASIHKAIEELRLIGWLQYGSARTGLTRTLNEYVLTPFSEEVRRIGDDIAREERAEIEWERAASKAKKAERDRQYREAKRGVFGSKNELI
jgi:hypothetical protein